MSPTGPGQSPLLLLDAIPVLEDLRVDYAVIGAMAASFHGAVRASVDADALISLPKDGRLDDLAVRFEKAGFRCEIRRGDVEDPIPALLLLKDSHGNRVDLLAGLRGMDPKAFLRSKKSDFMGKTIRVIGLEDFIAMKIYAGGPKDLQDVKDVLEISGESLDRPLLKAITGGFGKTPLQLLESLLK